MGMEMTDSIHSRRRERNKHKILPSVTDSNIVKTTPVLIHQSDLGLVMAIVVELMISAVTFIADPSATSRWVNLRLTTVLWRLSNGEYH
jgi:hypothetical protein